MTETPAGKWDRLKRFVLHDVWDLDLASLSAERSFLVRIIRVAQLVVKGFREDDLAIHASALTFVTLTSLVPLLAVVFALLKGFGFGQEQIESLLEWKTAMPEGIQSFLDNTLHIVNTTNFSALGWVGLAFVVLTAVMVLMSVEISFNRIWGISTSRGLLRQTANYISLLVLVPFLVGIASTLGASLRGGALMLPESMGWIVRNLLRLTSLFTAWLAFWFLFVFVPNTRVRVMPASVGSLITALVFLLWQKAYIALQIGVARYNAIYGTFASIPIFLAWLYISWVIILLGAELSFALQNSATYRMESASDNASVRARLLLSLGIIKHAAESLLAGSPRFEVSVFARVHRVPIRLLNHLVSILVRAGLLAETADRQGAYVLLRSPESIRVYEVVETIFQQGATPQQLGIEDVDPNIAKVFKSIEGGITRSLESLTIRDLVRPSAAADAVSRDA